MELSVHLIFIWKMSMHETNWNIYKERTWGHLDICENEINKMCSKRAVENEQKQLTQDGKFKLRT